MFSDKHCILELAALKSWINKNMWIYEKYAGEPLCLWWNLNAHTNATHCVVIWKLKMKPDQLSSGFSWPTDRYEPPLWSEHSCIQYLSWKVKFSLPAFCTYQQCPWYPPNAASSQLPEKIQHYCRWCPQVTLTFLFWCFVVWQFIQIHLWLDENT